MLKYFGLVVFATLLPSPALASETISYTYDALGRLTADAHSGTANNGVGNGVAYDPAGNRTSYAVTGVAAAPSLSIADASATEGGTVVFTVTRAGSTASVGTVNYATANGTATAGADYTAQSGTLTFAVGVTSQTISVATIDDTTVEASETFTVTLSNPSVGVTLTRATATGTIIDNDSAPITSTNPSLSYSQDTVNTIGIATLATLNGNSATISAFTVPSGDGSATIAVDGQSVSYTAPHVGTGAPCTPVAPSINFSVPYTIRNSANGTTTAGSASVTVKGIKGSNVGCP